MSQAPSMAAQDNPPVADAAEMRRLSLASIIATTLKAMTETPIETPIERPTIAELEAILNAENPPPIRLKPDGSVVELKPHTTTIKEVALACADAIIAGAPTAPGAGWRDIASAPKDGTYVLLTSTQSKRVLLNRWTPADDENPDGWDDWVADATYQPTHWAPCIVPEPPAPAPEEGR